MCQSFLFFIFIWLYSIKGYSQGNSTELADKKIFTHRAFYIAKHNSIIFSNYFYGYCALSKDNITFTPIDLDTNCARKICIKFSGIAKIKRMALFPIVRISLNDSTEYSIDVGIGKTKKILRAINDYKIATVSDTCFCPGNLKRQTSNSPVEKAKLRVPKVVHSLCPYIPFNANGNISVMDSQIIYCPVEVMNYLKTVYIRYKDIKSVSLRRQLFVFPNHVIIRMQNGSSYNFKYRNAKKIAAFISSKI